MRTLLYIFSVRNAIKRKKDLFSLKRSATCAIAKNNLLKRFATSARAEVAQLALCASNCGMPTSALQHVIFQKFPGEHTPGPPKVFVFKSASISSAKKLRLKQKW